MQTRQFMNEKAHNNNSNRLYNKILQPRYSQAFTQTTQFTFYIVPVLRIAILSFLQKSQGWSVSDISFGKQDKIIICL